MFRDDLTNNQFQDGIRHPATSIADEFAQLLRRTLFATVLYAFAGTVAFTGLAFLLLWRFMDWMKSLPGGVKPSWERLVADRPDLLVISGLGLVLGIALAVGGMWMWRRIFGPNRMPPRKLVWVISTLPLGLVGFAIVATAARGALGAALTAPFMLGMACALLPFQIGFLAYGMLRFSLRQVQQRPIPSEEDELPAKVAAYFQDLAEAAEQCKLELVGDFSYGPNSNKYRRYYMAPNGAYFVDATYVTMGTTLLKATSVFSATSDGHYFETCDLANTSLGSDGSGPSHTKLIPGAPLDELIEAHVQAVADWTAKSGSRPQVFSAADVHALCAYGVTVHMRDAKSDFMWLGNPYANQPVPPLPGRGWEGREELETSGVS